LLTRPEFAVWLDRLHNRQLQLKLSTPALETLSIVAYRQPITRADIEAIRGVQSTDILRHVMERGLVRIGGEEDSLGRPFLYETTRRFLELFGLTDLDELPNAVLLRRPPQRPEPSGDDELTEESVEDEEADEEDS
jgi:segregation and condensation protein B